LATTLGDVKQSSAGPRGSTAGPTPVLRVLTNRSWLGSHLVRGRPVKATLTENAGWLTLFALWRYDAVLLDQSQRQLLLVCAAKKLLPFLRTQIVSVDIILARPRGLRARVLHWIRRWLFQEVDRFVLYYRDVEELSRVWRIAPRKITYIPFKANTRELLDRMTPSDEGFFLSCGRSNRDYDCLFSAAAGLPYRFVVLAPFGDLETHGTNSISETAVPSNVSLASDDGSATSWNDWIARSTAVILPIEPGMLSPSGIGTYLVAQALGKCVIITESPATRGLLDERTAVLVPASDPDALRAAVVRVAEDAEVRTRIAAAGKEYATGLGGEDRLRRDIIAELEAQLVGEAD
jgi:glycosyltransferase involved in cell wall biosynthesis